MKRILIYTSFNSRSRDTESVMEHFIQQGHEVFLLTQEKWGVYHDASQKLGVKCFDYKINKNNALLYFLKHTKKLISFIREHKIDIVFAHLENAALPAVLAQFFLKTKIIVCRHIVDEAYLFKSKKFILQNKIVYRLAKNVIVVSNKSKQFMIKNEHINGAKIDVVNLAYNFNLYPAVDDQRVKTIKNQFHASYLIISICRLVESKRPLHSIQLVEKLLPFHPALKLIILGNGPLMNELKLLIKEKGLEQNVFLLGHVSNPLDYISASDLLVHPSILDSSSVAIKEAGLLKKPIIACSQIGDLDEYIINYESGILVNKDNFVDEAEKIILKILQNNIQTAQWGENLNHIVHQRFSIENIGGQYNKYLL